MEMVVEFSGGARVDAHFGSFTVLTDQPPAAGGAGSAPAPFELFLASIATCAGYYVLSFCQQRSLAVDGIRVIERTSRSKETHLIDKIDLEIQVPPSFPDKYHQALVNSAELCAVKKHLETPPKFNVYTQVVQAA